MKRILYLLVLTVFFTSIVLTGCGSKETEKSEEELRAEIKAELEAEKESKQSGPKVDIKDLDSLYEYVNQQIVNISRERFNHWQIDYMDITGDGTDEAILIEPYGANWHDQLEIISSGDGQYKRIPSNFILGKNGTIPYFQDGFLTLTSSTSGTGEQMEELHLLIYNGTEMVSVLGGQLMNHVVAFPDASFTETGTTDGNLTDFIYTLTKYNNLTNKTTIEKKEQYTYDANAKRFNMKVIEVANNNLSQTETNKNDFVKNYTYQVDGGNLKTTFNSKTETLIKANGIYQVVKDDGQGPFTMDAQIYVLSAKKDGAKLYFKAKASDYSISDTNYYIDVLTKKIYFLNTDSESSSEAEEAANPEESDDMRISGFRSENINGIQVNFSDHYSVVVPMYNGKNMSSLVDVREVIGSVTQGDLSMNVNFAIFGHLQDIKITYYQGMGSDGDSLDVGTLYNANVNVEIWIPGGGDMSHIKVTGNAPTGDGDYIPIEFVIDDMRDAADYGVIFP